MAPVAVRKRSAVKTARSAVVDEDEVPYNFVLVSGNRVEIFPPERFHEMQKEIDRALSWGTPIEAIRIEVLEADDPFR